MNLENSSCSGALRSPSFKDSEYSKALTFVVISESHTPDDGRHQTILKGQLVKHEALKKAGKVVPFAFPRDGERIKEFRTAWTNACTAAGCQNALIHDMRRSAVRTFERRVFHARWRCRSSATRLSRSTWMRGCNGRLLSGSMLVRQEVPVWDHRLPTSPSS